MHTMYIDKNAKGANLMQAIARVNRVYKDKPGGLIVDYIGIGQDLRNAMATYLQSGGEGTPIVNIKRSHCRNARKARSSRANVYRYDYKSYFSSDTTKLKILLGLKILF